jgi:Asp-tRNA(Asn)/Glu-tRNA(Gln) amidotransferase A subunit family amidase
VQVIERETPVWLEAERAAGIVSLAECGVALGGMDLAKASAGIRARAANAARLSVQEVAAAREACAKLEAELVDTVVTPTWPFAAPPIHAQTVEVRGRSVPVDPHRNCFVRAANAANACAITIPMGLYPTARVPAGLHLVAPAGRERSLLAAARVIAANLPPLPSPPPLQ